MSRLIFGSALLIIMDAALLCGCNSGDVSPRLASPETNIATSQPAKIDVNNGLKALFDPIVRLFTREKNVTVSGNTAPVIVQQSDAWKYLAIVGGVAALLWLMPSGWPFRARKPPVINVVLDVRGLGGSDEPD